MVTAFVGLVWSRVLYLRTLALKTRQRLANTEDIIDIIVGLCSGRSGRDVIARRQILDHFKSLPSTHNATDDPQSLPKDWLSYFDGACVGVRDPMPSVKKPWEEPLFGVVFRYRIQRSYIDYSLPPSQEESDTIDLMEAHRIFAEIYTRQEEPSICAHFRSLPPIKAIHLPSYLASIIEPTGRIAHTPKQPPAVDLGDGKSLSIHRLGAEESNRLKKELPCIDDRNYKNKANPIQNPPWRAELLRDLANKWNATQKEYTETLDPSILPMKQQREIDEDPDKYRWGYGRVLCFESRTRCHKQRHACVESAGENSEDSVEWNPGWIVEAPATNSFPS